MKTLQMFTLALNYSSVCQNRRVCECVYSWNVVVCYLGKLEINGV